MLAADVSLLERSTFTVVEVVTESLFKPAELSAVDFTEEVLLMCADDLTEEVLLMWADDLTEELL